MRCELKQISRQKIAVAGFVTCLICFCAVFPVYALEGSQADAKLERMVQFMQKGDFRQAIVNGTEAEKLYAEGGKVREQVKALLNLSASYESLGRYRKSVEDLGAALVLAEKTGDRDLKVSVVGRLGNACVFINKLDEAEKYLKEALALAAKEDYGGRASALNYFGNLRVLQKKYDEALAAYREGLALSGKSDRLLAARISANIAKALVLKGDYRDAEAELKTAYEKYMALDNSHDKAYGLINIGRSYRQMGTAARAEANQFSSLALKILQEAFALAVEIGDHLSASYASGYAGQVYEETGRFQAALSYTRRAIFETQQVIAPESLYLWQWQSGRIFRALNRPEEALSVYRSAVNTLQSIRNELLADCRIYNQLSFQDVVEPLYFELADMLLKSAGPIKDQTAAQAYLREARQTIELLKTSELQNYFQDACVVAGKLKMKELDVVSPGTAVVYVIPLKDRLELLLGLNTGIRRFTVEVGSTAFTEEVRAFRKKLEKRTTRQYLPHAQRLYDWLVRPLIAELVSSRIDTLVFVPHGPMRTIPMAALHDGKGFLVQRFSMATTPGLSLTDPSPIRRAGVKVLLNGLTESVQGFPALINVATELKSIQELYTSRLLLNNDFRLPLIRQELEHTPYSIVHMASHGEFFENSDNTYILTWDEKITMDQLEKLMMIGKFRKDPVELLTLSACVTAAGDDRAALGLAGVAVKAGARSALATLWYINDHTGYEIATEFYRQLQDASFSKAKALQQAQIQLIENWRFGHPGYWAPFLLIGNWL